MSMSPNMTEETLDAVMGVLPEEMNSAELCALMLTIYTAYTQDTAEIMDALISSIYTFGSSRGFSHAMVSIGLRIAADLHDSKPETKH